jgi:hypothetical protein
MANYDLTQTGDEVQAYIDSIPVIDVTGTQSGSTIAFGSNPYTQIDANYTADCGSVIRLTVGSDIYLMPVTKKNSSTYTASVMIGAHNIVATITSSSASAVIDSGVSSSVTPGSNDVVTGAAVAEYVRDRSFILTLTGNGNTYVSDSLVGVLAGHTYRVNVKYPNIDMTGVTSGSTYYRFAVRIYDGATAVGYPVFRYMGSALASEYYFKVPDTIADPNIIIGMRAAVGAEQVFIIEDVTEDYADIAERLANGLAVKLDLGGIVAYGELDYSLIGKVFAPVVNKRGTLFTNLSTSTSNQNFIIKIPLDNVEWMDLYQVRSSDTAGSVIVDNDGYVRIGICVKSGAGACSMIIPPDGKYLYYYTSFLSASITLHPFNETKDIVEQNDAKTNGGEKEFTSEAQMLTFGGRGRDTISNSVGGNFFASLDPCYNNTSYYVAAVDVSGYDEIEFNSFRTSSTYGSFVCSADGTILQRIPNPSGHDVLTDKTALADGAKWFIYSISTGTTPYIKLYASEVYAKKTDIIIPDENVGDYLAIEQGRINSTTGEVISSDTTRVVTSFIQGGRGFWIQLFDAYKIKAVHLFNEDGTLAYYNYVAPDSGRAGITLDGTTYGNMSILPQFKARIVLCRQNDVETISANEKVIASFTYLDNRLFSKTPSTYLPIMQKRLQQINHPVWEVLADVPIYSNTAAAYYFKKGRMAQGIPYSDVAEYDKYVGNHVSFHTFLTAAKNKRSLLYTEKCNDNSSEYGLTYHNGLAWAYFGAVCSSLTAYVANFQILYLSGAYQTNTPTGMTTIADASFDNVQPLDFVWNSGHISIISDIILDEYGQRLFVVIAEQTVPVSRITPYNRASFEARLARPSEIHRYSNWDNLTLPDATPEIQMNMWDYPRDVVCDEDIHTFAGDKATFAEGDIMFLNLNRTKGYTTLEIYKDEYLLQSINITNTSTYPSDGLYPEDNEDWVKFDLAPYNLAAGKYKARLTGSGIESGYTYWEVINIVMSVEVTSNTKVTFSSSNGTPYLIQNEQQSGFPRYYTGTITDADRTAGYKTLSWVPDSSYPYVKIFVRGDYGVAVKRQDMIN